MNFAFLMMMVMFWCIIPSFKLSPLEDLMRKTLKKIMICPSTDEDMNRPVAAFSPARYMQLVAVVRKDSRENTCGRDNHLRFTLNDPRTWNFCSMGICSYEKCLCFKDFNGSKCNQFSGKCWLFYCHLKGCNLEPPSLYCACNPTLYGTPVTSGILFYDHGLEESYIPPPHGFRTTSYIESHLIRDTGSYKFEIIGGNYINPEAMIRRDHHGSNSISRRYPNIEESFPSRMLTDEAQNDRLKNTRKYYDRRPSYMSPQRRISNRNLIPPNRDYQKDHWDKYKNQLFHHASNPIVNRDWFKLSSSLSTGSNDIAEYEYDENGNYVKKPLFEPTSEWTDFIPEKSFNLKRDRKSPSYFNRISNENIYLNHPRYIDRLYGDKINYWPDERRTVFEHPQLFAERKSGNNPRSFYSNQEWPYRRNWITGNRHLQSREYESFEDIDGRFRRMGQRRMDGKIYKIPQFTTVTVFWADSEEQSGDYKFTSGSKYTVYFQISTFICSGTMIFALHFLQ